jgi:hypothetical protein
MSRNLGANGHNVRECEACGELFCADCSKADDSMSFCSGRCEREARAESRERELTLAADCAARARDMNMGGGL